MFKVNTLVCGIVFTVFISSHAMMRTSRILVGLYAVRIRMVRLLSSDETNNFPIFLHGEYHDKLRKEMGDKEYVKYLKAHREIGECIREAMKKRFEIQQENEGLRKELLKALDSPFKEVASTDVGQKMKALLDELSN